MKNKRIKGGLIFQLKASIVIRMERNFYYLDHCSLLKRENLSES